MFSKPWNWLKNKLIKKKRLALCLEEGGIGYCLLEETNNRLFIRSYGYHERDESNDWENDLKTLYSTKKLKSKDCLIILSKDQYEYFLLDRPNVKVSEFEETLKWKVRDYLEYSAEDAVLDYMDLPKSANSTKRLLYFIAANEPLLLEKVESLEKARFKVKAIDIAENALKSLASFSDQDEELEVFLSFAPLSTTLLLLHKGHLCMMRHLDINMRAFFQDQATQEQRQKILEQISFELEASIGYSTTVLKHDPAKKLLLAPTSFFGPKCLETLAQLTGMQVRQLDLSQKLLSDSLDKIFKEPRALPALGALIEGGVR